MKLSYTVKSALIALGLLASATAAADRTILNV